MFIRYFNIKFCPIYGKSILRKVKQCAWGVRWGCSVGVFGGGSFSLLKTGVMK